MDVFIADKDKTYLFVSDMDLFIADMDKIDRSALLIVIDKVPGTSGRGVSSTNSAVSSSKPICSYGLCSCGQHRYIVIADGMSIARVWACRYSK